MARPARPRRRLLAVGLTVAASSPLLWALAFTGPGAGAPQARPDDVAVGRRLATIASLAAGAGLLGPGAGRAAIPDMDEFEVGTGSKIRLSDEERQLRIDAQEKAWASALQSPLPTAAQEALTALQGIDELIKALDLDGARAILMSPSVSIIGVKISPSRSKVPARGAWAKECAARRQCDSSLSEIQLNLQQLEEWCFNNRLSYFNKQDRDMVMAREGTNKALEKLRGEIGEPLEYLDSSRAALREVLESARKA